MKKSLTLLAFVMVFFATNSQVASAAFHLWHIREIYSNADGSVQFVELFTAVNGQHFLNGHTLTSTGNTFNFTNSPAPTGGHHLLLATAGFQSLPGGATPDYVIPSNFFNPAGDTINFAEGTDVNTFASPAFDGILSLNYTSATSVATTASNSPRNYAGAGGSIDLSTPEVLDGDYNGDGTVNLADYTLWRDNLGAAAGTLANDLTGGVIDHDQYAAWKANFGNTTTTAAVAGTAVPEPKAAWVLLAGVAAFFLGRPSATHRRATASGE